MHADLHLAWSFHEITPDLARSESSALDELAQSLLRIGDTAGALAAATRSRQLVETLLVRSPNDVDLQHHLARTY